MGAGVRKDNDLNDFKQFCQSSTERPPAALEQALLSQIDRDLHPSGRVVFFKLLALQSLVGVLTLLFCPQFHLSLTANDELFHFFHRTFGEVICMSLCGAVFVGTGSVIAVLLLSPPEMRLIRETASLHYFALSSIFLCSFLLLGAEFYLELISSWLIGASLFGALGFELTAKLKMSFVSWSQSY